MPGQRDGTRAAGDGVGERVVTQLSSLLEEHITLPPCFSTQVTMEVELKSEVQVKVKQRGRPVQRCVFVSKSSLYEGYEAAQCFDSDGGTRARVSGWQDVKGAQIMRVCLLHVR